MSSEYTLCGIVALCAIAGCRSAPEKKTTEQPKTYQSAVTHCIGRSPIRRYGNLMDGCNLSMRAKVPMIIKPDKQIAIQIPKHGTRHILPCHSDSPWVGHLEKFLIAKCIDSEVWLYWVEPKVDSKFAFSTTAILYDGENTIEYVIRTLDFDSYWGGSPGAVLEFVPIFEKDIHIEKPDTRTSDEIIEEALRDSKK